MTEPRMHEIIHTCVENTQENNKDQLSARLQILQLLLNLNRELLFEKNGVGDTPLHVKGIHIKLLLWLIDHGGDVGTVGRHGKTVLHTAPSSFTSANDFHQFVVRTKDKYLQLLLKPSNSGKLSLHYAMMNFEVREDTLKLMQAAGILDLNSQDENGNSVFLQAIIGQRKGNYLKMLCNRFGANHRIKDHEKRTGLHISAMHGNISALNYFLADCPAYLQVLDSRGRTPLHCTFLIGHKNILKVVQLLIPHGVDVNAKSSLVSGSKTALHIFLQQTPKLLHMNSEQVLLKIIKYMKELGAKPTIPDKDGNTPFHTAFEFACPMILNYFINLDVAEENILVANNAEENPVHKLLKRKDLENPEMRELIKIVAEAFPTYLVFNTKNNDGKSVIDLATIAHRNGKIDSETLVIISSLG